MSQILFLFAQLRFFFHLNCTSKHSSLWDFVFLPNSDSICLYFRWLGLATQIQLACLPLITELLIHSLTLLILNKSRPSYYFLKVIFLKYSPLEWFILCYLCMVCLFNDRHVEELIRQPECFLCYIPSPEAGPVAPTPALSNGFITFGSFNNLAKVLVTSVIRQVNHYLYWKNYLIASIFCVVFPPFCCFFTFFPHR
jgi:hypothetical protein